MALRSHHPEDVAAMKSALAAILEAAPGSSARERLAWLDTDDGKNHRHVLGLWDAHEDAALGRAWATRNPTLAAGYLEQVCDHELDQLRSLDDGSGDLDAAVHARAYYWYGFDLFDDVRDALLAGHWPH